MATADEMGTNLGSVVDAVDGMNESFNKITADARTSKSVAGEAIAKVADAKGVMDALGVSAHEIGQFTDVIKSIAKKTNAYSTELKEAATTLAKMAERIDSIVRKFKT